MSSDFRDSLNQISLKDAVNFIVDNRGKTAPTESTGIALIATNCVNNKDLYPQKLSLRYVSKNTYETWFRSHPQPGDILLTNKGSQNGAICLVPEPVDFCIAQDMVALRADPKKISPLYLFAALRSDLVQKRIKALNVDAVIPHLKKTDFNKLYIPLPEPHLQHWIGDFYFEISKRIELLRETNTTLESIAQTLFKSWFVDFDPVRAKQQGTEPQGMDAATAALFPDSFEESELGEVPKGWRVGTIGEFIPVVDFVANGSFASLKKNVSLQNTPSYALYLRTTDFNSGYSGDFRYVTKPAYDFLSKSSLNYGDVVISNVGDVGTVFRPPSWLGLPMTLGSNAIALKARNLSAFMYFYFSGAKGQHDIQSIITGSAQLKFNKTNFRSLRIALPEAVVLNQFEDIASTLLAKIDNNLAKVRSLATLRDTLLPHLISGQLRLGELEIHCA